MNKNTSQTNATNDENLVIANAATINYEVSAGDLVSDYVLSSGSILTVLSGGSAVNITLSPGATEYVSSGGVDENANLSYNTTQYVDGGIVNGAQIGSGLLAVYPDDPYPQIDTEYTTVESNVCSLVYSTTFPDTEQYVINGGVVNNTVIIGGTYFFYIPEWISGIEQSNFVTAPAYQYISNGGVANHTVLSGGVQYIYSGGIASGTSLEEPPEYVQSGYVGQYVCSAGVAYNTFIVLSNKQEIQAGGTANSTIVNGGSQLVYGIANATSVQWGNQDVYGVANNTYIGPKNSYNPIIDSVVAVRGSQTVYIGGIASNTLISGGDQFVYGSVVGQTTIASLGAVYVKNDGHLGGNITISSGGHLYVENGGYLDGAVALNLGGNLTIGLSNGGAVDLFGDTNRGLTISGYASGVNTSVTTEINGFNGTNKNSSDKLTIDGLKAANISTVTYPDDDHIALQLLDGTSITLNMVGIKQTGYTLGSDIYGNLTMVVCFLSGTMIGMAKGVCAVEDLQVGDAILTYDPQTKAKVKKKITWVGKQKADVNVKLPDDMAGYPVRILKDAFKKNVPNKDLLITSEHCLFIDGYFVPARMLVNGRSIFYDYSITSYDFYHIETEDHAVIWADGMLTESYLNTGNRHTFNKDQKVVKLDPHVKIWEEDAAAPLTVDRSFVEPIFDKLVKRADKQKLLNQNNKNITLSNDHGLYLLTEEGEEVYQSRIENDKMIFTLPANTQNIYLVSRKSRPCDIIGPFVDDRRYLGVLVGKVSVLNEYGAYPVTKYLQQDELQGWSVVEQSSYRWTMGCAFLPLDVYNVEYSFEISIQIVNAGPYIIEAKYIEEEKIAV